jgi:penicillin-binding protein 1A
MEQVASYAERLKVVDRLPRQLSMAIGAGETTLMRLVAAYATVVNWRQENHPDIDRSDPGPEWYDDVPP